MSTIQASTFKRAHARLASFLSASPHWDGVVAKYASAAVGASVSSFLSAIESKGFSEPSVVMGDDGTVATVWIGKDHYITADFCDAQGYTFVATFNEKVIGSGHSLTNDVDLGLQAALDKHCRLAPIEQGSHQ